jgi:hypothetical protein
VATVKVLVAHVMERLSKSETEAVPALLIQRSSAYHTSPPVKNTVFWLVTPYTLMFTDV